MERYRECMAQPLISTPCKVSPIRACMDRMLRKISPYYIIKKEIILLDIGKKKNLDYKRFFPSCTYYVTADIDKSKEPDVVFDATRDYPFKNKSIDVVLSFNLMEHIFEYEDHIKYSSQVLREDGIMIVFVPFAMPYHADPRDFWRFTKDSLFILFKRYFQKVDVITVGIGPIMAALQYLLPLYDRFSFLRYFMRLVVFSIGVWFDYLLRILADMGLAKTALEDNFPLGYFVIASDKI